MNKYSLCGYYVHYDYYDEEFKVHVKVVEAVTTDSQWV